MIDCTHRGGRFGLLLALLAAVVSCDSGPGLRARFELERLRGGPAREVEVPEGPSFDMFLDPDSLALTPFILEHGIWERSETALFVQLVKPGQVVVDIGANVGYFTLLAAELVGPEGTVYAFEPDPVTFEFLERNVRLNGLENVVLENKAVSSADGDTLLFFDDSIREDGRIYEPTEGVLAEVLDRSLEREQVEVETVRLDSYLKERERVVDLVKVDTQGAEAAIVEGMHDVIAGNPGIRLIVEFVPALLRDFGADPAKLVRDLERHGLSFQVIHPAQDRNPLRPVSPRALERRTVGAMLFLERAPGGFERAPGG